MFKFDYGKYRGIIISVALFLLLDASVLILNFYISFEIADDAIGVNLAGRQRMLSQRMAKTLFVLENSQQDPAIFEGAFDELILSQSLFDETLMAFINGGTARDAAQSRVHMDAVTHKEGQESLQQALVIWQPYKESVLQFIDDVENGRAIETSLASATAMARSNNLALLGLMNDLTITLENVATSKATRLRWIQTVGISLAILNFLFIMLHFIRQLKDSDRVLEKSRRETTEILETVNEGLFLIDKNLIIGDQHSAKLTEVLGNQKFSGESFLDVLENIINEKNAETARGFIELLFDPKIKEKLIGDLNPLSIVEVNIAQKSGGFATKYLKFDFARAYQDNVISHVLVTVLDITEQVKMEKALSESQKHNESQIEMLTGLLHTHPSLLKEFISNCYKCYGRINTILSMPAKNTKAIRDKADGIFKEIHNLKGESSALKLDYFENSAHAIEENLSQLRGKSDITGNDYLGLAVQLESLINYTQQVEVLITKLQRFSIPDKNITTTKDGQKPVKNSTWGQLEDFVENIAMRNGKQVTLVASGLHEINLPAAQEQQLKEVCIQLLRNAVVHGIESPYDREISEKPPCGRIDLRLARISKTEMELTVMDDGQGLNYDAIREQAIASGKWSEDEIESWDNKRLLKLIFNGGFTTAKQVTKDAGRGVGMDAVMSHVLTNRGKINVSSRRGHYCRFVIVLPLVSVHEHMAA